MTSAKSAKSSFLLLPATGWLPAAPALAACAPPPDTLDITWALLSCEEREREGGGWCQMERWERREEACASYLHGLGRFSEGGGHLCMKGGKDLVQVLHLLCLLHSVENLLHSGLLFLLVFRRPESFHGAFEAGPPELEAKARQLPGMGGELGETDRQTERGSVATKKKTQKKGKRALTWMSNSTSGWPLGKEPSCSTCLMRVAQWFSSSVRRRA